MRMLVVAVVVIGCRDYAAPTGGSSVSPDVAASYMEVAWLLQGDYTAADKEAVGEQMRSFEICRQVGPT